MPDASFAAIQAGRSATSSVELTAPENSRPNGAPTISCTPVPQNRVPNRAAYQ